MNFATIISNPLVKDALSHLRDKGTERKEFRYYSDRVCHELLIHAVSEGDLEMKEIQTPVEKTYGKVMTKDYILIPIFRAGLAMLPSALQLFPSAKVGFVGLARDEKTAIAHEYYWNIPEIENDAVVLITDPMLATGGSLLHVLRKIAGPHEIRIISVIAAPEGIDTISKEFPNVRIFTAAIDEKLNDKKYIVPGLGDYGDRYFS